METFSKSDVTYHEFQMYKYIDSLSLPFVPKLISFDEASHVLTMQKINGMNLSDMFGEKFKDVPGNFIEDARRMIATLHVNNVVYPDITGYNFILEKETDKLWLVDFEHSFFRGFSSYNEHNDFVQQFIRGIKSWNPYFA
jgi:tRNA A-37 threonylcarbamoyl transferase component Bud32